MAVIGVHALIYTPEAEALRALLTDAIGWSHVDAGEGWLIFALPPAELGVHPGDQPHHELSIMCDDIAATVAELTLPKFRDGGLLVVHAGGGAGLFSAIIGGWASGPMGSEPVTREVQS